MNILNTNIYFELNMPFMLPLLHPKHHKLLTKSLLKPHMSKHPKIFLRHLHSSTSRNIQHKCFVTNLSLLPKYATMLSEQLTHSFNDLGPQRDRQIYGYIKDLRNLQSPNMGQLNFFPFKNIKHAIDRCSQDFGYNKTN